MMMMMMYAVDTARTRHSVTESRLIDIQWSKLQTSHACTQWLTFFTACTRRSLASRYLST